VVGVSARYLDRRLPDVPITGAISPEDAAAARVHAYGYAGGDAEPGLRPQRYADWYYVNHVVTADGLEDVPDHPNVWLEFLAQDEPLSGAENFERAER
jgi:hypothetical protein